MSENPDVEKWVQQFIGLRDMRKALKEEYEKKDKELRVLMDDRAGRLQAFLDKSGVESAKTAQGTVYATTRYTASLADPQAFMDFVIQRERWDLLDRKANATAVRDYVQKESALPPGCNLSALTTVGVRRPGAKKDNGLEHGEVSNG